MSELRDLLYFKSLEKSLENFKPVPLTKQHLQDLYDLYYRNQVAFKEEEKAHTPTPEDMQRRFTI